MGGDSTAKRLAFLEKRVARAGKTDPPSSCVLPHGPRQETLSWTGRSWPKSSLLTERCRFSRLKVGSSRTISQARAQKCCGRSRRGGRPSADLNGDQVPAQFEPETVPVTGGSCAHPHRLSACRVTRRRRIHSER